MTDQGVSLTLPQVQNVLRQCLEREANLAPQMRDSSWSKGFCEGQVVGYQWALDLLERLEPEPGD